MHKSAGDAALKGRWTGKEKKKKSTKRRKERILCLLYVSRALRWLESYAFSPYIRNVVPDVLYDTWFAPSELTYTPRWVVYLLWGAVGTERSEVRRTERPQRSVVRTKWGRSVLASCRILRANLRLAS